MMLPPNHARDPSDGIQFLMRWGASTGDMLKPHFRLPSRSSHLSTKRYCDDFCGLRFLPGAGH